MKKMKENKIWKISLFLLISILLGLNVEALNIEKISQTEIYSSERGTIELEIRNTFNKNVKDVSINLDLSGLPFIPIGSSEKIIEEIKQGKSKNIEFEIKASNDAKKGDYSIPYIISYNLETETFNGTIIQKVQRKGTIGISVKSKIELSYSIIGERNVVGERGKITLRVINKGFGDVDFVSVKLLPNGYSLLSSDEVYIGTISSNDFESASFDVIFTQENPTIRAIVEYRDSENKIKNEKINLILNVYSREDGIKRGIIKSNNYPVYLILIVSIIIIFASYRIIKRRKKKNYSGE
ncbi:MAG: hypothetical protein QXJ28_01650 [Candidatus Pacearchaeota archaeon]